MAHFAQIDESNIVQQVIVVSNDDCKDENSNESEVVGTSFCQELLGGDWKQTSYNTRGGVHLDDGTPLRKNFAGIGDTYDATRDAFIPPQPYPSWTLDENTCRWEAPIPYPTIPEGSTDSYAWDELTTSWVLHDLGVQDA